MNCSQQDDFKEKLIAFTPSLRAFAYMMSQNIDQSQDLVQEAMVHALQNKSSFEEGTNMQAWLYTILRNIFLSQIRKRDLIKSKLNNYFHMNPSSEVEYRPTLTAFLMLTKKLSYKHKEVLFLCGVHGLTYAEAAKACCCTIGTIKSRLSRARKIINTDQNARLMLYN